MDEQPSDAEGLTPHEARNRASWDAYSDEYQAKHGAQLADSGGLAWGTSQILESELRILGDVAGKDILEFGCGAAQWSIALARAGARPVGLDLSARQLEHARRLMAEAGVDFPLVHGSAEAVPLPDASFDIVFCDHGAMTFADPYRTVPEAARLLRHGGLFAFNHHSPIETICWALGAETVGDRLALDYFGMHGFDDGEDVYFQLTVRGLDPALPRERFRRRGPGRAATAGRRHEHVSQRRRAGLGAALAVGEHLAAAPRVKPPILPVLLDLADEAIARSVLELQRESYAVEAGLIGSEGIPQLTETLEELQSAGLDWLGTFDEGGPHRRRLVEGPRRRDRRYPPPGRGPAGVPARRRERPARRARCALPGPPDRRVDRP